MVYHADSLYYPNDLLIYPALVFAGSLSFYAFHRLYSLWKLLPELPDERWRHTARRQRLLFALVPLGFVAALGLALSLPTVWLWLLVLPVVLSALYALPVFGGRRARDLGRFKVLWLTIGWVWLCSVVPGLVAGNLDTWYIAQRFLYILGFALAFDWRDVQLDRSQGVITWAGRLSKQRTAALSALSLLCSLLIGVYLLKHRGDIQVLVLSMEVVATILTIPAILYSYFGSRVGHLYYGFWLDALLVLPAMLLIGAELGLAAGQL